MNTTTMELVDIGANLSHESFDNDLDQVLGEAASNGVVQLVLTGSCLPSSIRSLELCRRYPDILYSTVGLHPHHAADFNTALLSEFREIAGNPAVRAIGETGLDFFRDLSPRPQQEKSLQEHLALARELQMPAFLHQRDAHERFLPIIKEFRDSMDKIVVHCFTGDKRALYDYLDLDLYIGITGWICDERRGHHLHPLVKDIPPERLMIETDCPYLMPRTIRPRPKTRRNVPANLVYVLETVASCVDKPESQVAQETTKTAREFFGL